MAQVIRQKYCRDCEKATKVSKVQTNHVLHLLLTIFTGGCWLVIWILVGLINAHRPYTCDTCGHKISAFKRAPKTAQDDRVR